MHRPHCNDTEFYNQAPVRSSWDTGVKVGEGRCEGCTGVVTGGAVRV